jgi:tRNA-specific 2-thiouridylase
MNWLTSPAPLRCTVKLRAREAPHGASVVPEGAGAVVRLDSPALAAPGQACVMYDGERMLGGGFIARPAVR